MALLNDILTWTETLPVWQRDAARRLLQSESGLAEDDYVQLYALLKSAHELPGIEGLAAVPLSASHIQVPIAPGETVVLKSLRDLQHVNCIASDQALDFGDGGLSIIYGENGTGKSGYARVLKRACRARDQSEPIHPNAHDSASSNTVPAATIDVCVSGRDESVVWSRDAPSPEALSMVSVFDSRCARSYLSQEQDVAYRPYGLDIVENLANTVLPKLKEMLESEIASISVDTQPFTHLLGETEVGTEIASLSASTDAATIKKLGFLSEEDSERLVTLSAALKEADPLAKARELRLCAGRFKALAGKIASSLRWVSEDSIAKFREFVDEKATAEEAESKSAETLQSGETLLTGTGEQAWKLLFEAARKYSTESAYPEWHSVKPLHRGF